MCVSPLQGHSEVCVRRLITSQRTLTMKQMLPSTSSVSLIRTRATRCNQPQPLPTCDPVLRSQKLVCEELQTSHVEMIFCFWPIYNNMSVKPIYSLLSSVTVRPWTCSFSRDALNWQYETLCGNRGPEIMIFNKNILNHSSTKGSNLELELPELNSVRLSYCQAFHSSSQRGQIINILSHFLKQWRVLDFRQRWTIAAVDY